VIASAEVVSDSTAAVIGAMVRPPWWGIGWLMGLFVPYSIVASANSQVAARVTPRIVDLVAALATEAVVRLPWHGPMSPTPCPAWRSLSRRCRPWLWSG
jgi:hypothetical protein